MADGFDCEFVEKPPKVVQSDCPVCLQIIREPYQATCCGYAFCQVCIERVKADNTPCPCCKAENFDKFEDKRLKRMLYGFNVYCTNKNKGCKWVGELSQLDNHLNSNQTQEKQQKGCQFIQVSCVHCSIFFLRSNIQMHQTVLCSKRPFRCEYCRDYDSTYEDVTTNHWPECGHYPVQCPNRCGKSVKHRELKAHISIDCPQTIIDCEFSHVGCEVQLPRKNMPAHLTENVVKHVSLQANNLKHVIDQLRNENKELEEDVTRLILYLKKENKELKEVARLTQDLKKENQELKKEVARLTQTQNPQQICIPVCPPIFIMDNFEQRKRDNEVWHSPPFYTYPKGYKMCLGVYANGYGDHEGTHTGLSVHLMKGEFDDQLKWPLRGQITIRLLSHVDIDYEEFKLDFVETDPDYDVEAHRLVTKEIAVGPATYISHTELQPKYLSNDFLKLSVHQYTQL